MKALIVINLQNDYCIGNNKCINSLNIIPKFNKIRNNFNKIIFVNNEFSKYHTIFTTNKEPLHCIKKTFGSEIPNSIIVKKTDDIIIKGNLINYYTYSAFYHILSSKVTRDTLLEEILKDNGITDLYICGNNFETVLFSTAISAWKLNYNVIIYEDIIGYKSEEGKEKGIKYLKKIDIKFI